MKLIVGLGNPGKQYEKTRHNAGFMTLDALAKAHGVAADDWKEHRQAKALVAEAMINGVKCLLVKPQTFMNDSGRAVQPLAAFYKVAIADIAAVHDELDIPFGTIRVTVGASAGGHKGVGSIIDTLGDKAFARVRIGIGSSSRGRIPTDTFVLQPFSLFERLKLSGHIGQAAKATECLITQGAQACMNRFN